MDSLWYVRLNGKASVLFVLVAAAVGCSQPRAIRATYSGRVTVWQSVDIEIISHVPMSEPVFVVMEARTPLKVKFSNARAPSRQIKLRVEANDFVMSRGAAAIPTWTATLKERLPKEVVITEERSTHTGITWRASGTRTIGVWRPHPYRVSLGLPKWARATPAEVDVQTTTKRARFLVENAYIHASSCLRVGEAL